MNIFPHNAWRAIAATSIDLSIQQGASAAVIQGFGSPASNPALQNGNIITFETGSESVTNLRTYGIVSIVNPTTIQDSSGRYNTTGKSLANNQGYTSTVILRFSTPVSAFGFNLGGADYEWSLSAAGQSYTFKPDANGNKMNYYGISGEKISSATLSFGTWDWVLIDNLTYVAAVPEPATWALMLVGFGLTGAAMRRRSSQRATQALA